MKPFHGRKMIRHLFGGWRKAEPPAHQQDVNGLSDHILRDIGLERTARTRIEPWWERQAFFDGVQKRRP